MHKHIRAFLIFASCLITSCSSSSDTGAPDNQTGEERLLQAADFTYLGAFRVPAGDMGGPQYHGLNYGGSVITYNPANNSLFIVGHTQDQLVAEISIPAIVNSPVFSDLNTAAVLQNLSDITEGNRLNLKADGGAIAANGCNIGGLLKYGNILLGTSYAYYDGGFDAVKSHFTSSLTLAATGDFSGMLEVGVKPTPVPQAGHVAGYMAAIPSNWQSVLGGKVLTGMSALSILGRTSSGPALFSFDPADLNTATPAPAHALIDYPLDHQTIGTYYTSQTIYNKGSHHSGIVWPNGTKSIIVTGKQGIGAACYGSGTNVAAENGRTATSTPNTCMGAVLVAPNICCYDPVNLEHGAHAYPYSEYVWLYDAADLARVKAGGRVVDNPSNNLVDSVLPTSTDTYKPWFIKPYAHWQINLPTTQISAASAFSGASAYDESTRTMYFVQTMTDSTLPLIHAFRLNTGH